VPVSFSEINNFAVLAEMSYPDAGMMPELSFGTHFFLDLVETHIFYTAIFLGNKNVYFNEEWLSRLPNQFKKLLPDETKYQKIVRVFDLGEKGLHLFSDLSSQRVISIINPPTKSR
jgi:hypothetical protein